MFDIGWTELLLIGIVALVVIGPKELPGVLRMLGQWMTKIRRMASEFQGQFQEAMREAEMAELKKQVDELSDTAKGFTNFDPIADVKSEIAEADKLLSDPLAATPSTTEAAGSPAADEAASSTPVESTAAEPRAEALVAAPEPAIESATVGELEPAKPPAEGGRAA